MTPQTKNILSAENLAKTKKGVRIINCARGGLVDEKALARAARSAAMWRAPLSMSSCNEPATENPLFGHPNVVCTPHLGASTSEAQENVALQVAEQMSDYLIRGAISNAVNFPSITAEEAPKLKPFIALAEPSRLLCRAARRQRNQEGRRSPTKAMWPDLKTKALTASAIAGLLRPLLADVNVVSAPGVAKERGIAIDEVTRAAETDYESLITLSVSRKPTNGSVSGTVFHDGKPRIISINGIDVDAVVAPVMIYVSERRQAGLHRPFRESSRQCRDQYRDLRARPRPRGRLRGCPRRGGRSRPGKSARRSERLCRASKRSRRWRSEGCARHRVERVGQERRLCRKTR